MTDSDNSFSDDRLDTRERLQWELLTSFGIISQLMEERARQLLPANLPRPLFSILNHFIRVDGEKTVTDVARAFQVPQPGMTKSVRKLIERGYLVAETDAVDARRKRLFITEEGRAAHFDALQRLGPDADLIFRDWTTDDMVSLQGLVFRLRRWLDDNRETRSGNTNEL